MEYLIKMGERAREAARVLNLLGEDEKNRGLRSAAMALTRKKEQILAANEEDVKAAREKGVKEALIDRLSLTGSRIDAMAGGLLQVAMLEDPVGETICAKKRPNGLNIAKRRVPLGVVGIIYESRPNVTADAFGLCFKTGNAVILKGGSDALQSNGVIVKLIREALEEEGLPADAVQLIEDTSRETAAEFMRLNGYVDVLIPRGGAGLIRAVVENSTLPVIETGTGNCHIYVDETANLPMAVNIIDNAKTQRMGVCNACESLVVHENIAKEAVPAICERLSAKGVEIRGCERAQALDERIVPATEEDYGAEYLDAVISVKVAGDIGEAVSHINRYNTGHSEAIITRDYDNARRFTDEIDAAAVYVNASTRFTDGFEFGFGAEIGISTQKLHARGPMGLEALTTVKYVIEGNGQVRG